MNDKKFLLDLENICMDILKYGENKIKKKRQNKKFTEIASELRTLTKKRFGWEIDLQEVPGSFLATYPPFVAIDSAITIYNVSMYGDKDLSEATGISNYLDNNTKALIDGFIIDYNKKHIYFKGAEIKSLIICDPIMFRSAHMTPKELAAIMLHEIGHDFEYIRYTAYMSSKAQNVLDKIKDSIQLDNPLDGLIEVSIELKKEVSNSDIPNIEEMTFSDKIDLVLSIPKNFLKVEDKENKDFIPRPILDGATLGSKEFEIKADDFSLSFGMATDLASALKKAYMTLNNQAHVASLASDYISSTLVNKLFKGESCVFKTIMKIYLDLFMMAILLTIMRYLQGKLFLNNEKLSNALNKFFGFMIKIYIAYYNMINIQDTFIKLEKSDLIYMAFNLGMDYFINYTEKDNLLSYPYDETKQRFEHMKRQIVHEIKSLDIKDSKGIKKLLTAFKDIEKTIDEAEAYTNRIMPIVLGLGIARADQNIMSPMYVLNTIVREFIDNDLYVKSAEFSVFETGNNDT